MNVGGVCVVLVLLDPVDWWLVCLACTFLKQLDVHSQFVVCFGGVEHAYSFVGKNHVFVH